MSHDICTPINGIMGMVDIAEHYADDPDKQQECREKIRQASGYLLDLVNGILDMNKLESGAVTLDHKPFDIIEVLAQANSICQMNGQERALRFTVDQPDVQHAHLVGSPLHLRQILLNIAGNAVKCSRPTVESISPCAKRVLSRGKPYIPLPALMKAAE